MEEDHTWDNQMTVSKGNPLDRNIGAKQSEADFNMGWVDMGLKGVSNKIRPIINGNKGNQKLKPKSGSVLLKGKEPFNVVKRPKKGTWTREVKQRPNCNSSPTLAVEIGVKRKAEASNRGVTEVVVQEKMKKVTEKNEDTRAAEVARQARRDQ